MVPEHETRSIPFEECTVDLIRPWIIQVNDKPDKFNALTVIDTVSKLVELIRIDTKTSAHVARKYGRLHDNGGGQTTMAACQPRWRRLHDNGDSSTMMMAAPLRW